ncbi:MAG: serine hydrolase [Reyranellaceae bacterium]
MNRRTTLARAAALLVSLPVGLAARAQPAGTPRLASSRGGTALSAQGRFIDQMIADYMERHGVPGLAMAIVQAPYIPRSAGYGRASLEHDELAATRTLWNIGPITQGFTAVAIFQLVEAGKLALDDPIGKYLSALPAAWSGIALLQLLQHASGLPDFRAAPGYEPGRARSPAELLALVADRPLTFAPGERVQRSATGFLLLGLVIERVSGVSYRDFVTRHQIEPLGLRATMFASDFAARAAPDRPATPAGKQHSRFKTELAFINPVEPATGYGVADGRPVARDAAGSTGLGAFGALWASAEDISVWDIALASGLLVRREDNRARLYGPTRLANGTVVPAMAGWEFTRHPGFMEIKGSAPGFSAYLSRFTAPDDLVCVTLLANKEGLDLTDLARDIATAYKTDLGPPSGAPGVLSRESKFTVDETVSRLETALKAQNVPVFASFDHAENAKAADLTLRPTKVLVFGTPRVGTKLMQDSQAIGLDLPLRVAVWQDERGRVWISHHDLDGLANRYGVTDEATVQAMVQGVARLVARAADVYAD